MPNIYFRPDPCHILVKNEQKCKIYQKFDNSCISEASKISKRQSIMLSTPAKLNAQIWKTSSERLKLTIQSFKIENKELKEKVMELQQELSKSSLKVSLNLGEDLTFIMTAADQLDIPPFMIFFWKKQQKYLKCSSRGIQYHQMIIRFCSASVYDDIQYDEKSGTGILILSSRCRLRDYKNYIKPEREVSTKSL